eukprot:NODE_207_length_14754_cov_0.677994.p5 type:complete len:141 gc:universal NODE_207_length_14754_cov_0.677994:9329-8907(-)
MIFYSVLFFESPMNPAIKGIAIIGNKQLVPILIHPLDQDNLEFEELIFESIDMIEASLSSLSERIGVLFLGKLQQLGSKSVYALISCTKKTFLLVLQSDHTIKEADIKDKLLLIQQWYLKDSLNPFVTSYDFLKCKLETL